MSYNVDFGKMTEDETRKLAIEALGELRLDQRIKAVLEAFSQGGDKEALASELADDEVDDL